MYISVPLRFFISMLTMEGAETKQFSAGYRLAHPEVGENIVISGISGRFPNSHNTEHYFQNLMNKVDLCDEDERRCKHTDPEIPRNIGKIYNVEKFDSGFFGIHPKHSDGVDPQTRLLLERAFESVMDAGMNPKELEGSRTGVFIGSCSVESQKNMVFMEEHPEQNAIIGQSKSMQAQNINYFFKLNGPASVCDTACSSGMWALEQAYRAIRDGICDQAFVGASNLLFHPNYTLQFRRLGVLHLNDVCRPFDENSKGYTRSEAVAVLFVQKSKDAKRIYSEVVHMKSNVDGFKTDGITFPSAEMQTYLAKTIFEECCVPVEDVGFVEAHATGTRVGDAVELNVINSVYCTKNSRKPLLIGSVKGNIGHGEAPAGINSIIKVLLSMEAGVIPPNIHFETPRADVKGLHNGNMKVVTEVTSWPSWSDTAVVNCFGFGGTNSTVLLRRHRKSSSTCDDGLPRLVCFSGRTTEAVTSIQDYLRDNTLNYEYVKLLQNSFRYHIKNHVYRGYSILNKTGEIAKSIQKAKDFPGRQLYLCIGTKNTYSTTFVSEMQKFSIFRNSINNFNRILRSKPYLVVSTKSSENSSLIQAMLNFSVQIGCIDVLNNLGIRPDHIVSSSVGSIIAAYADGVFTMEETIFTLYIITKTLVEASNSNKIQIKLQKAMESITKTNCSKYSSGYFLSNILNYKNQCPFTKLDGKRIIILNIDYIVPSKINNYIDIVEPHMDAVQFLSKIGSLYEFGYEPKIWTLYSQIKWPVSTGTPNISSLIKWNHKHDHYVPFVIKDTKTLGEFKATIDIEDANYSFVKDHVIDGRKLFPATGYLVLVWQMLASSAGIDIKMSSIQFENVKFLKATIFAKLSSVEFHLNFRKDGYFEISENSEILVNGYAACSLNKPTFEVPHYNQNGDKANLLHNDIYKLLRIHGYQYKGKFCELQEYADDKGLIKWEDNWETFLDNMCQILVLDIIQKSKAIYIPTGFSKFTINAEGHLNYVKNLHENKFVPVFVGEKSKYLRSRFIEIIGFDARPIASKQQNSQPLLEIYEFVPNDARLTINVSTRVILQIIIENLPKISLRITEYIEDPNPLTPHIIRALEDIAVVQSQFRIFTPRAINLTVPGAEVLVGDVDNKDSDVYIIHNSLNKPKALEKTLQAMTKDSFLITIENSAAHGIPDNLVALTTHTVGNTVIYLFRNVKPLSDLKMIRLSKIDCLDWIIELQNVLKNTKQVLICSENQPLQGTLGLVNSLRREPDGEDLRCVFVEDSVTPFDTNNDFYSTQMRKGMTMNIFRNDQWGTYRYKEIGKRGVILADHCFVNVIQKGNLSTLAWMQGPLTVSDDVVQVYCSAINFRDIMIASGKMNLTFEETVKNVSLLGLEYSGINSSGERVMGITKGGAISTLIKCDPVLSWPIPKHWSMEEAAAIPIVYSTVLLALLIKAKVQPGQSILIHSGTGGIGLAAINVALYFKMNIFTTVGTNEKKEYLKKLYPLILDSHIGNSRDITFERMVHKETEGRGVDVVLNSLTDEKLLASVRCLAKGSTFLEIGKLDLMKNESLDVELINRGATYHGVMLDYIMERDPQKFDKLKDLLNYGIEKNFVKPLPATCFNMEQLKEAFRYIGTGNHIGKVLLKIRDSEADNGLPQLFPCISR